jgi:hypothetical protein
MLTVATAANKMSLKVPPGEAARFISGVKRAISNSGYRFASDRALAC